MDLSIIIVNWNTKPLLSQCIQSIKSFHPRCEMEIIVVDNGSEDGSAELVRQNFPEVILIENGSNLGFGKANNIGMSKSTGRYVCLVNSDVRILRDCLDNLCGFMNHDPLIAIAGPRVHNPDMTLQDSCRRFPSLWTCFCEAFGLSSLFRQSALFCGEHMFYFSHSKTMRVDSLAGCFLMVKREALDEVGGFDERFFIYAEEVDWCKRFWRQGWEVVFYPGAAIIHDHAGSSSKDPFRFAVERERSLIKYWKKHHSFLSRVLFYSICSAGHLGRVLLGSAACILKPSLKQDISQRILKHKMCLKVFMRQGF